MDVTAPVFAGLALFLAGPAPALLSRATWPYRSPRAALVLWQAIALAAVLSAFGSGLAIASRLLVPGSDGRPTTTPSKEIDALGLPIWLALVTVFALTLLIGARLIWSVVRVGIHTRRRRAHHRMLVDLLDQSAVQRSSADIRVLASTEPIAYCLPGLRRRVVLSQGTVTNLTDEELTAIVSHERSHLRARHDLVLEAFTAAHEAFPRVVRSKSALDSVKLLIELLADDSAVKVTGPTPLARALVACCNSTAPQGAMAVGGPTTLIRIQRLAGPIGDLRIASVAYLAALAILVVPTMAVAIPWLTELSRLISRA
ncbi:M56 family metallopeptidase [Nocardia jejuensis]|uniref:M56 family metallopeptidase n=1 Tax=Nocardia jejuensis TaxID=328049 RepID=UPI00082F5611|nr:M56 family metallopeptidase [Nocardia jejuensis]